MTRNVHVRACSNAFSGVPAPLGDVCVTADDISAEDITRFHFWRADA